jgi:hypothetical protein
MPMLPPVEYQNLTPRQLNALPLLASGTLIKDVAIAIKVNTSTVSQWVNHNQDFRKALNAFSSNSLSIAETQLELLAIEAIAELRLLLKEAKSEQVRLKAIEMVLASVGLFEVRKIDGQRKSEGEGMTDAGRYDFNKLIEAVGGS